MSKIMNFIYEHWISKSNSKSLKQVFFIVENVFRHKHGNWQASSFEALLPLYPTIILFFILSLGFIPYENQQTYEMKKFESFDISSKNSNIAKYFIDNPSSLAFAPMDDKVAFDFAKKVCDEIHVDFNKVVKLSSFEEMENVWKDYDTIVAGVYLAPSPLEASNLAGDNLLSLSDPSIVDFDSKLQRNFTIFHHPLGPIADNMGNLDGSSWALRSSAREWNDGQIFSMDFQAKKPKAPKCSEEDAAIEQGLVYLQFTAAKLLSGEKPSAYSKISMERMPIPEHHELKNTLKIMFPMNFAQSFVASIQSVIITVGSETDNGIREQLFLKGLVWHGYMTGWLIAQSIYSLVPTTLLAITLFALRIIQYTNFFFLFGVILLYGIVQTAFSLMFVAVFGERLKAQTLFICTLIMMTLWQGLFYVVQYLMIEKDVAEEYVHLTYLLYVIPFCKILFRITDDELLESGMSIDSDPETKWCILMLCLDFLIYVIIIYAAEYDRIARKAGGSLLTNLFRRNITTHHEQNRNGSEHGLGIVIKGLKKTFPGQKKSMVNPFSEREPDVHAVNGIDLESSSDGILAIIGHNGAGKTTLLNMLIGSILPTEGDAWVHGLHVVHDRTTLRENLGVCPQHDVLFEYVSAKQQLSLMGKIQGIANPEQQADEILNDLGLTSKANELAGTFSGGQKRRLSLGMALMGNPKVILLDEVTSGTDVSHRRAVWRMLQERKKQATIILTTHSMEEASVLASRVAIVNKGKVQAFGTPLELENKFGSGYSLNCVLGTGDQQKIDKYREDVTQIVQNQVPEAKLTSKLGNELVFSLPQGNISKFPDLFRSLEKLQKTDSTEENDQALSSFGVTPPSLEQVFSNLGAENRTDEDVQRETERAQVAVSLFRSHSTSSMASHESNENRDRASGDRTVSQRDQLFALLKMIVIRATRSPVNFAYLLFWPAVMSVVAGSVSKSLESTPEAKLLQPSLIKSKYDHTIPYVVSNGKCDYGANMLGDMAGKCYNNEGELRERFLDPIYEDIGAVIFHPPSMFSGNELSMTIFFNHSVKYSSRVILQKLSNPSANVELLGFEETWDSGMSQNDFAGGGLTYFVAICFALLGAMYTEELVRWKVTHLKEQLLLAGLGRPLFFIANIGAHFLLLMATAILSVTIMALYDMDGPRENNPFAYFLLFFAFSVPSILFGYSFSYFVNSVEAAQEVVGEIQNLILAIPWLIVSFALDEPNNTLENVLSIIPGFGLYRGMAILQSAPQMGFKFKTLEDIFDWDKVFAQVILMLFIDWIIWGLVILALETEFGLFAFLKKRNNQDDDFDDYEEDTGKGTSSASHNDNDLEHGLLNAVSLPSNSQKKEKKLVWDARNIKKNFKLTSGATFEAVRDVSLQVERGTIVALLGENGAGKSTFLTCITQGTMTSGRAKVQGYDVVKQKELARREMGVCPQSDIIIDLLTIREHLQLFGRIRGLDDPILLNQIVDEFAQALDLSDKIDSRAHSLSGGQKRRLQIGMALIGSPRAVILDEPTTGLDPESRRIVWDFLINSRASRGMILVSHSMEESEALGNRIVIMGHGRIQTQGTSQELKDKFGTSFLITIRIRDDNPNNGEAVDNFMKNEFPNSQIDETFGEGLTTKKYIVPKVSDTYLSGIFERILRGSQTLHGAIIDFSIAQASLEDVFLKFANQKDDRE